ncbi:TetR/AcrR family transcriptional regulator [Stenotrophomonas mori]|uniref:TetR/AcrR family transcriptional regulator n=1 Tax=Stenotrophomonas mori TaxID=2871096 RepID=A0ABT0SET3_9GAMM|nr:TetR/AcrR family transcriptional regulator [Stenotrophomonas mori]MCL7713822.1 TetR/AcrR family transcriptional regulator [Stenotrophomonas mori]
MHAGQPPPARGRPRRITPQRIAEAGIALGLPNLTFVGVAGALGVSPVALYRHVPNLEALKHLVAEAIFQRWAPPLAVRGEDGELEGYLRRFVAASQALVKAHPGLTPYLLRRSAATAPMLDKIGAHQRHVAEVFGLSTGQARWLLATLAFHCFAGADALYSAMAVDTGRPSPGDDRELAELEAEFAPGMDALIVGVLAMLEERGTPAAE